ncbi:MAG: 16S rRNA methyltransferase, partial [Deltaproteobacteria bacterium]
VAIGPEGGFSPSEAELAAREGFKLCSMGPRILRLETAVIKVLSVLQYVLGDG